MSVKIRGLDKLLAELETKLGKQAMQRISDEALINAAKEFVRNLKSEFESFKDEGYSIEEITIKGPEYGPDGARRVTVHWSGPHGRYRIIHLNEWGTIKNPNPRGKGAVARAMKNSEKAYRAAVRNALKGGL
ncbi:hypothetical protein JUJ52_11045 [Virgibacillus sp. AGTR]|uniref:hypothetical protein n=1 Tax=Virgibacillus sp. AGTR TaxID=2812055 RepID=UPI00196581A8|nr:hypothetical protein [Virgibacillus sp. AGTR]MCC2250497.1 hypothetical protein [Virgibacillus sp. AGTR]QRZ18292.1 hypothetical protein JUJ52_00560 [Virgibacillus sp. AGTR]